MPVVGSGSGELWQAETDGGQLRGGMGRPQKQYPLSRCWGPSKGKTKVPPGD